MGAPLEETTLRVVLDTNVVVSALVFREGRLAAVRQAWAAGRIVPLVSAATLGELIRVLAYPKLRLDDDEAKALLSIYVEYAEVVARMRAVRVPDCKDPDDLPFLRLAHAANADALVTGDRALLAVAGRSRIPVIRPEELLERMGGG